MSESIWYEAEQKALEAIAVLGLKRFTGRCLWKTHLAIYKAMTHTISPERAAERIMRAARRSEKEVQSGAPALEISED